MTRGSTSHDFAQVHFKKLIDLEKRQCVYCIIGLQNVHTVHEKSTTRLKNLKENIITNPCLFDKMGPNFIKKKSFTLGFSEEGYVYASNPDHVKRGAKKTNKIENVVNRNCSSISITYSEVINKPNSKCRVTF